MIKKKKRSQRNSFKRKLTLNSSDCLYFYSALENGPESFISCLLESRLTVTYIAHTLFSETPSRYIKHQNDMRRFYTTILGPTVRMVPPVIKPERIVKPNPNINNMPFFKSDPVINKPTMAWQDLPHIRTDFLPEKATDIRGVDTSAHQIFSRRPIFGKIPTLFSSRYFTVTFIPHSHIFSSLRKSNVAYTFTNYGCPNLNDNNLQKSLVAYRGKYRSLEYFKSIHSPMGTAVSRGNFRKLVKRALYRALHEIVPNKPTEVEKVAGIFHFRFSRYPVPAERNVMRNDVLNAVKKLYTNQSHQRLLEAITQKQNREYPNIRSLARDVRVENILGATTTPGYFPKLPYFRDNSRNSKGTKR